MAKSDFIPPSDDRFGRWHDQFMATGSSPVGATVGLTAGDNTQVAAENTDYHDNLNNCTATEDAAKQAVKDKNNSRRLAESHARALAQRIKTHPAYTPAIGELFGIEGAEVTPQAEAKPTGKVTALPDYHAEVKPHLKGAEAVDIYCQREGDASPVFLGRVTHAHFIDTRPPLVAGKPEQRHYSFQLVRQDQHWGPMSDPIGAVCSA